DLHAVPAGERGEPVAELVEGITVAGEMDTAAQAHPVHALEDMPELRLHHAEEAIEKGEIGILAVVVDHEAGDLRQYLLDLRGIPLAEPAEGARRIGEVEARRADLRIETQSALDPACPVRKALKLADRV